MSVSGRRDAGDRRTRGLVVGNHAPTRSPGREEQTGTDAASMTLVIRSPPPLLLTQAPMAEVPLAKALAAGWIPPGLTTAEPVRHARRAGG